MAYLDENGLQRFYNGISEKITLATIQANDSNNDGNIVLSFPSSIEGNENNQQEATI